VRGDYGTGAREKRDWFRGSISPDMVHWWASNWDRWDRTAHWLYVDRLGVYHIVGLYVRALGFDSRFALQHKGVFMYNPQVNITRSKVRRIQGFRKVTMKMYTLITSHQHDVTKL
jgi:hypothetical protein